MVSAAVLPPDLWGHIPVPKGRRRMTVTQFLLCGAMETALGGLVPYRITRPPQSPTLRDVCLLGP